MQAGNNFSSNISVDKSLRKLKMFSKDIEFPIASDKTDKRDGSVRDVINFGLGKLWGWKDGSISLLLDELQRRFTFKAAIAMVSVMEEFKVPGLRPEMAIAPKPLSSKESSIVGLVETFHHSITPRFSYRDEDHFDSQKQTESQDDAKGARITIASSETEFVVHLEKVWNPHGFPTAEQALGHSLVVFGPLGIEKDSVARAIHDIE